MSARRPGVYRRGPRGALRKVHEYRNDGYGLDEVVELMAIGTPCGQGCLSLTGHELRLLAVTAHAQSFDHDEAFVAMCLDLAAERLDPDESVAVFVSLG